MGFLAVNFTVLGSGGRRSWDEGGAVGKAKIWPGGVETTSAESEGLGRTESR